MKLRLVEQKKEMLLLCPNGSILKADETVLTRLLCEFKNAARFKGEDGYWNMLVSDMEKVAGTTLAYVDDQYKLIVLNPTIYSFLRKPEVTYVSATEYANMHGKSRPSIKNMCAAGRIEGAYKTSSGWLIPSNAPYPTRKPRATTSKE